LILNRDRHGANIEVLRNRQSQTIRLAPLFDHGLSLLHGCAELAELSRADVMEDKPVNNYIGSRSALNNLSLIPKGQWPAFHPLRAGDEETLLAGLEEALPQAWREKIWQMIVRRWQAYESLRDQG
jgi:serine/threonine protein kinase HipA of HipAB toxin-antitoxin module